MKKKLLSFLLLALCIASTPVALADQYDAGLAAYRAEDYSSAEQHFREAIKVNPNNCRYRYYLAITLVQQGKIYEAERHYKKVIELAPGSEAAQKSQKGLALITNAKDKLFTQDQPTAMSSVSTTPIRTIIPINKAHSAIIVPKVLLNDKLNVNFFLDTGATYTSISKQTALKLGLDLNHCRKVSLKTVNGLIKVPLVVIDSININGVLARNVQVTVHDLPAAKNITGLLGLSFLEQFKVTIDRKNERVILERS